MTGTTKNTQVKSSKTSAKSTKDIVEVKVEVSTDKKIKTSKAEKKAAKADKKDTKADKKDTKTDKKATKADKKAVAPKKEKKVAVVKKEAVDGEDSGKPNTRSFKVQLPGTEEYVGRFTGLTPYQAANKALSKYFRETKKPKADIRFSIRESTRGSKRSIYTYNGQRQKLDTPVEYVINNAAGEARTITKKFKNKLIKVKKNELAALEH
jgi:hypothetical protein